MAKQENGSASEESAPVTHTDVDVRYAGPSGMVADGEETRLALFGNLNRDPVFLDAISKDPIRLREALATLYTVVGSDFRYVPKDRTAYHAYRRMRNQSANLGAWQAQHSYFDWLARNDPYAFCILDPVISVHPDKLFFEVFSKDEGTYSNLSISLDAFDCQSEPVFGTTNIDFSADLFQAIEEFRSYRETRLTIGQQAVQVATSDTRPVLEKKIRVPDSWLRGFLQVQSCAMLPGYRFQMSPMDLYNVLRFLRMHKDQKGKRRGLRIELVPGEAPRIVLEPWEELIECTAGRYSGTNAKVIRIWGRRRLRLLRRMLPLIDQVEVNLTGSGLPSFWVLRSKQTTFTLGLTGFTSSNWSQAIQFDMLLPREALANAHTDKHLKKIIRSLAKNWRLNREQLGSESKLDGADLLGELQRGCQLGQLMYDVADEKYRLRPLTDEPISLDRLEYRNRNERFAYDLVLRQGSVAITRENQIFGRGHELTGNVKVAADRREYQPQLLITEEGFVSRAECTCSTFRQQGLKQGPCEHLVALRIAHAIRERARREGSDGESPLRIETRTFSKRANNFETIYQITLDERRLKVSWGESGKPMRVQQFRFPDLDSARSDYLERVGRLLEQGFLDAS